MSASAICEQVIKTHLIVNNYFEKKVREKFELVKSVNKIKMKVKK